MASAPRKRSRGHPFLAGRPKGVWYPDAVGVVKGYPKTQEAWQERSDLMRQQVRLYNAEGITGRKGVPDGWAGRKQEALDAREEAREKAERAVQKMIEQDLIAPVPAGDEARAELALTYACQVVLDPTQLAREKLAAARLIADFTRPKPAQKTEVTVNRAEDFLDSLLPR